MRTSVTLAMLFSLAVVTSAQTNVTAGTGQNQPVVASALPDAPSVSLQKATEVTTDNAVTANNSGYGVPALVSFNFDTSTLQGTASGATSTCPDANSAQATDTSSSSNSGSTTADANSPDQPASSTSGCASAASTQSPLLFPDPSAQSAAKKKHVIHWGPFLGEEFFDIATSHAIRLAHEPFTRAALSGPFFKDWGTILKNWEWNHWSDDDRWFTTYVGHSSQGNLSGWIYRNNDDDGDIEQNFSDPNYRRILRNSFLVETAYAFQWKLGPLSEATIGHVGLTYNPIEKSNRSGLCDLTMDEVGGTALMVLEDFLDKHVTRPFEAKGHSRAAVDTVRMAMGLSRTYANLLSFHKPWYRQGRN